MNKRLKHKFAAIVCNREGGKSQAKVHDAVQLIDNLTDFMAEEYMQNDSNFIRTEVVDFLEQDARKKFERMKKRARVKK